MATTKPTVVIIHGAWHIPTTYSKLTDALRSANYEVHLPRLPSMNEVRPPNADLATDTAFIRSYTESLIEAGRTVVALMHSYGGQVGTNALHGLSSQNRNKGGVSHLIYLSAFALPEGGSMVGKVKEFGHEKLLPLAFDFADDNTVLNRDPKSLLISPGPNIGNAEVEAYLNTLVCWNGTAMYQSISQCAWREIPVSYIQTAQDKTVPLDYQKSMIDNMRKAGREVQTFQLDTGHCANLTATDQVVDAINQIVG